MMARSVPLELSARLILIVLTAFVLASNSALACTTVRPTAEDVSFQSWVANAHRITLARVTGMTKLPTQPSWHDDTLTLYKNPYKFSFSTTERIKGDAPERFDINGFDYGSEAIPPTNEPVDAEHFGLGLFWTWFHGHCRHTPAFVPGSMVLLFQDADGRPIYLYGRNPALIQSPDNPWIQTIRSLVRNPGNARPRIANITDFLRTASHILITETTKCAIDYEGRNRVQERRIIEQLWGGQISVPELEKKYQWDVWDDCDLGMQQLMIVHSRGYEMQSLRLRTDARTQIVDFSGFLDGTDEGIVPDTRARWASQIDFKGPRRWTIAEIKSALRQARSETSSHN